jgi:hypothetical protein
MRLTEIVYFVNAPNSTEPQALANLIIVVALGAKGIVVLLICTSKSLLKAVDYIFNTVQLDHAVMHTVPNATKFAQGIVKVLELVCGKSG